jgi:two-component system, NtrC family, response regulator AlgB
MYSSSDETLTENDVVRSRGLNVLVVDDESNIRRTLAICLESLGHRVTSARDSRGALAEAERQVFDLSFVDLRLGLESGLDLIPDLLGTSPWLKIVVITAYASVDTAVEAIRRGACDYIPKPFTPEQIEIVSDRVAKIRNMEQCITELKEDLALLNPEVTFSSRHPVMQRAIELARHVAPSEAIVLIRGASGTGKTVLARAIHGWSQRSSKPLGVISCPTLNPELLESELFGHVKGAFTGAVRDNPGRIAACEGGTLLFDEIGDLPLSIQPKLLRFIQDREYERVGDPITRRANVRIIAASNMDLDSRVEEGLFREDLYYRLNVIQIDLPPLNDRPDDVEILAGKMLRFFSAQNHKAFVGFTDDAMSALRSYSWPGNMRELRNAIERAAILCSAETVGAEHLTPTIAAFVPAARLGDLVTLEEIEKEHIRRVVSSAGSLQEAAGILGVDQTTLWRKRKQYGI